MSDFKLLKVVSYEKVGLVDYSVVVEVEKTTGSLWWKKTKRLQWTLRGSGTVWHYYPEGTRTASWIDWWMSDKYTKIRWEEEDRKRELAEERSSKVIRR